jgi:hypothetical protein
LITVEASWEQRQGAGRSIGVPETTAKEERPVGDVRAT